MAGGQTNRKSSGISALVRCKDEGLSVYTSLLSIKDMVDEVIFIDNNSADNSVEEAKRFAKDHMGSDRFKLHNFNQDLSIGNNLSTINNFALSLTSYEWVLKWDVDTIAYTNGPQSLMVIRDWIKRKDVDVFRFGFYNVWGDYWHFLSRQTNDEDHGITGCGFDVTGLEKRLYRYASEIKFEMEEYKEHFWEVLKLPSHYRVERESLIRGVHLQTVKPAALVARRYFLTRFTPEKRKIYRTLRDYISHSLRELKMETLVDFGKMLIIGEINRRGRRFMQGHPDLLKTAGLLENPPYRLIFNEGICIKREGIEPAYDYLKECSE